MGRGLVVGALVALALGACKPNIEYHGNETDKDKVAEIKPGQSTKVQVVRLLGSPTTISPIDQQTWYYISRRDQTFAFLKPTLKAQNIVEISFDNAGVVRGIKRYGLKDARNVHYVARVTPTKIEEPSLLRSLYDLLITGPINRGAQKVNQGIQSGR